MAVHASAWHFAGCRLSKVRHEKPELTVALQLPRRSSKGWRTRVVARRERKLAKAFFSAPIALSLGRFTNAVSALFRTETSGPWKAMAVAAGVTRRAQLRRCAKITAKAAIVSNVMSRLSGHKHRRRRHHKTAARVAGRALNPAHGARRSLPAHKVAPWTTIHHAPLRPERQRRLALFHPGHQKGSGGFLGRQKAS